MKRYKKITEEELLKEIASYRIFCQYYDGEIPIGAIENHPIRFNYARQAFILHEDDKETGAIEFVMNKFGITRKKAVDKIAEDFGIIEGKNPNLKPKPPKIEWTVRVEQEEWTRQEDIDYWARYNVSVQELEDNNIYPCKALFLDKIHVDPEREYVRFVYNSTGRKGEKFIKVYAPHDPIHRWRQNIPIGEMWGLDSLTDGDTLMIAKAQKDRLIWKKYFTDVVSPVTESIHGIPHEIAEEFNKRYKKIYINYDNDPTGVKSSNYFAARYGWRRIVVPTYEDFPEIKDIAAVSKIKGLAEVEKIILDQITNGQ